MLLSFFGLWTAACAHDGERPETRLRVEYAGCETVLEGPLCLLGESRRLRLWVEVPSEEEVEILAGSHRLEGDGFAVQGGLRFVLEIPAGTGRLTVRRAGGGTPAWSLSLGDSDRPEWFRTAKEALRRGPGTGGFDRARHLAEDRRESTAPGERGAALEILAGLAMRRGDTGEATRLLDAAATAYRDAGRLLDEVKEATTVVFLDLQEHRFTAARQRLEALAPVAADTSAETACWVAYYRGVLAAEVGDARAALADLGSARRTAERAGMVREERMAGQMLGWQLQALGRSREAAEIFEGFYREPQGDASPCDRAELLDNHAWSLILAREAGDPAGDPVGLLEEARDIFAREACARVEDRINVHVNLALAYLHDGRPRLARRALRQARDASRETPTVQRLWWLDVEGRIALGEGRPTEALQLYSRLAELAVSASSPEARWRAALGRARAYEALGERAAALTALAEAEELLSAESLQVPIDGGRETFVAQREAGTRLYLELLLASGRDSKALELARRARSRVLRSLRRSDLLGQLEPGQRDSWYRAVTEYRRLRAELDAAAADDWRLSQVELRQARGSREDRRQALRRTLDQAFTVLGGAEDDEPTSAVLAAGETVLAYHPLPHGWVGFAANGEAVASHRFELSRAESSAVELAARLLEPFRREILASERVRILPYGRLREIDFHALPFGEDILLATRPVVYGLDLAAPPRPVGERSSRALLVADARGDLPAARREARLVRQALAEASEGWTVETLEGRAATASRVRQALVSADLFHFAGHGVFAGRRGWESGLALAAHSHLALGDLLTLARAPARVVLSGCETGRSSAGAVASIGLAHSFLIAGSQSVVAAVRPVGDRAVEGLVADLYRDWSATADPAEVLRRAQLAWRQRDPTADWQSFRLLEP